MYSALGGFLMLGLFAAAFGLVVRRAVRSSRQAADNVRTLAEQLGLEFAAGAPLLGLFYPQPKAAGQLRGRRVEVLLLATGSGKSEVYQCAVSATVRATGGLTMHLQQQGLGTKVMALFGATEIQVGEPEFDRAWFIQTNQPEFLRAALLPELRDKITALMREAGPPARNPGLFQPGHLRPLPRRGGHRRRPRRPGRGVRRAETVKPARR